MNMITLWAEGPRSAFEVTTGYVTGAHLLFLPHKGGWIAMGMAYGLWFDCTRQLAERQLRTLRVTPPANASYICAQLAST